MDVKRVLPDAPGWWWVKWHDMTVQILPLEVYTVAGEDGLFATRTGYPVSDPRFTWITEVPPPAECAAWAAAGRPSAAVLEALGVLSDWIMECIDYPSPETEGNTEAAAEILTRAIRAERAAQGSAPAGQEVMV